MDQLSQRYIRLAFALEAHIPGYVDAYFGPPELQTANLPRDPAELVDALATLRADLAAGSYHASRKAYLEAQLHAMETTARRLAGEELAYLDEVQALFDIVPYRTPEAEFEAALAELEELLPAGETLPQRMQAWKQRFEVSHADAERLIALIAAEARTRTTHLVELTGDAGVEFALVADKPWSGYNWYLGGLRSKVEINTDLPIRANQLLDLVCHEAYPGHHTEHLLKERELFVGAGYGEHAIQLINTPECIISEGIATLAAEMVFGETSYTWMAEAIYPLVGIVGEPEREARIDRAQRLLRALNGNAAIMLHAEGADPEKVVAYLMRYGLRSEREARQSLRFLSDPLWRPYVFTYFIGYDLLKRWIGYEGRERQQARFAELLIGQHRPAAIAAELRATHA